MPPAPRLLMRGAHTAAECVWVTAKYPRHRSTGPWLAGDRGLPGAGQTPGSGSPQRMCREVRPRDYLRNDVAPDGAVPPVQGVLRPRTLPTRLGDGFDV